MAWLVCSWPSASTVAGSTPAKSVDFPDVKNRQRPFRMIIRHLKISLERLFGLGALGKLNFSTGCKYSYDVATPIIVNGKPVTRFDKYPFLVGLVDDTNDIFCGGVIISSTFILTASHCITIDGWKYKRIYNLQRRLRQLVIKFRTDPSHTTSVNIVLFHGLSRVTKSTG
ncbi:hypothetical protein TNCV_2762261 [Trichonephila clavipes]|nr:hypothetical protein TNCV_2762261 [Trichonephila clavipes]